MIARPSWFQLTVSRGAGGNAIMTEKAKTVIEEQLTKKEPKFLKWFSRSVLRIR